MKKHALASALLLAITQLYAIADISETFTSPNQEPWDGTADLTWFGDTNKLKIVSNEVRQQTNQTVNVIVTDMGSGYPEGRKWVGQVGRAGGSMTVNGSNWGGLILSSDTTNASAMAAGNMSGFRVVWNQRDGTDGLRLEEATNGASWIVRGEVLQTGASWNMGSEPIFTVSYTTNGLFAFSDDQGNSDFWDAGGPVTLGSYTGFIFSNGGDPRACFGDTFSVIAIEAGEPEPIANPDNYTMFSDVTPILTIPAAIGVLENDDYPGSLTLEAILVENPFNGILNLNADGSFDYTPDASFEGDDTFIYKAVTSATTSGVATVTITVNKQKTVLHYRFDSDLTDSSGSGNDGSYGNTNIPSAITGTSKAFGAGSLSLTGTSDSNYVSFASVNFSSEDPWSASLWYNATITNTAPLLGDNNRNNVIGYNGQGAADRNYYLRATGNPVTSVVALNAPTAIDTGIWHHLVVTSSGTGGVITAYEDNVEIGTWSPSNVGMEFSKVGFDLYWSSEIAPKIGSRFFSGLIDEVWILNYELSATEVDSLYKNNTLDGSTGVLPAEIVSFSPESSDTMKMVIKLSAGATPGKYSPKAKSALVAGSWDPVAHSDSAAGIYAVSNLSYSASEGTNYAIYVKSTDPVEFFNVEAD